MGRYRVRVVTGAWLFSGSLNRVGLWLVGAHREAKLELQLRPARGKVSGQELGRVPPPPPQCSGWAWEVVKDRRLEAPSVRAGRGRLSRDRRLERL